MPESRLRSTLDEIHTLLEDPTAVNDASRAQLIELLADIQAVLDRAPEERSGDDDDPSLLDRASEAVRELEESHPALTEAIGRVATALSNLGI